MLRWIRGSASDHPLEDKEDARQLLSELAEKGPFRALEELAGLLDAVKTADNLKPLRAFEIVELLDRSARPLSAQAQPGLRHRRRAPDQVPAAPHHRHQLRVPDPAHRGLPFLPGEVRGRRSGLGSPQALVVQDRRAGAARLRGPAEVVPAALWSRGPADLGEPGAPVHSLGSPGLRALAAEPVPRGETRDHRRARIPAAADAGDLLPRRSAPDPDRTG